MLLWEWTGILQALLLLLWGALKKAINPYAKDLGIYICGGKGKFSKETPAELIKIGQVTGLNANELVRCSKLSAKVDNTAVQDGFQLYTHNFILSDTGQWTVIQQGMQAENKTARRYHWHSNNLRSFVEEPHTGVCGINQGPILNLTDAAADTTRDSILKITHDKPELILKEFQQLILPSHHDVQAGDVNLKRLGTVLWLAFDQQVENFEELLLLNGVGPRTVQSLTLVSEVIHGTPSRFRDPARFSFAHGGKDGHPFPVPIKIYDETIQTLQTAVHKAKMGATDKADAIKKLHQITARAEKDFTPNPIASGSNFDQLIEKEREDSWKYGGQTVFGKAKPPRQAHKGVQLRLF